MLPQLHQVVQLDQLPVLAANINGLKIERIVPVLPGNLTDDLVLFSVHDKITKPLPAETQLQCLGNVQDGNPQRAGLFTVDLNIDLGFVELQVQVDE